MFQRHLLAPAWLQGLLAGLSVRRSKEGVLTALLQILAHGQY
jgi:hypothetical protein